MANMKLTADYIFDGQNLLQHKILVVDENGEILDLLDQNASVDDVEFLEGIIAPGFVNCHCHLELSHMKNVIEEGTGLMGFVSRVMRLRHFSEEEIMAAAENAAAEMRENGIVAVGDICNTAHSISAKKNSKIYFHNFIELAGFLPELADARFSHGEKLLSEFEKIGSSSIVPHAPYSVSTKLLEKINTASSGKIISMHNEETPDENLFFAKKQGAFLQLYENMGANISGFIPSGKSSLQTVLPYLNQPQNILLVHNTCASAADIVFAENFARGHQQEIFWTLCPNANWYIERAIPPVELLRQQKVKITLGTDSIASNYQLNILSEIQRIKKHFPGIATSELLQWATLNGAQALGIADAFGSFDKGKKPGVILLDKDLIKVSRIV